MNSRMMWAMADELEKISSGMGIEHVIHGGELAGLGVLAHGQLRGLKSKNPEHQADAKKEMTGLGLLGGVTALSWRKAAKEHAAEAAKSIVKHV